MRNVIFPQNTEDVASLDKSAIEEETRQLEEELVADQKEEDDATELDGALGDVDNKVEQLTSSSSSNLENIVGIFHQFDSIRKCPGRS